MSSQKKEDGKEIRYERIGQRVLENLDPKNGSHLRILGTIDANINNKTGFLSQSRSDREKVRDRINWGLTLIRGAALALTQDPSIVNLQSLYNTIRESLDYIESQSKNEKFTGGAISFFRHNNFANALKNLKTELESSTLINTISGLEGANPKAKAEVKSPFGKK